MKGLMDAWEAVVSEDVRAIGITVRIREGAFRSDVM
jgi:hypothetical protein